jgi:hypothetical protein
MSTKVLQNQKYQTCIDVCNNCVESCEFCATSDLREQDVKSMTRCIQLNRDCANMCMTASQFMSRDSEHSKKICAICADICDLCAEECEKYTDH